MAVEEERDLTVAYKTTKLAAAPQNEVPEPFICPLLPDGGASHCGNDGQRVICFISNYSWLDGLSFTGMRQSYLEKFDRIWIDCLNGDKYKTGKLTPEGEPDPSVFSTEWNREGIQVGTAIGLMARKQSHAAADLIQFKTFWGKTKRQELIESLDHPNYTSLRPPLN